MRNLMLIFCLLAVACKQEQPADPFATFWNTFQGQADATLNGRPAKQGGYDLRVRGGLYKQIGWDSAMGGVTLVRVTPERFQREYFGFGPFPAYKTGRYKVYRSEDVTNANSSDKTNHSRLTLMGADGDLLIDSYFVIPTEDNYINITYFDREEIRGDFQVAYVKRNPLGNARDTIRFTNGTFRTKITINTDQTK